MKYARRPQTVKAVQWTGRDSDTAMFALLGSLAQIHYGAETRLVVYVKHNVARSVGVGSWVVVDHARREEGAYLDKIRIMHDDEFNATYTPMVDLDKLRSVSATAGPAMQAQRNLAAYTRRMDKL